MSTHEQTSFYLNAADLRARYHVSDMWIVRRIKDGGFPKPVKFGNGVGAHRLWRRADVEQWEAERTNQTTEAML